MTLSLSDLFTRTNSQIVRNERRIHDFIDLPGETILVRFKDIGQRGDIKGDFDESCYVSMSPEAAAQIDNRQLRLTVRSMNPTRQTVSNAIIHIGRQTGSLEVRFGSSGTVLIGALGAATLDVRLGHSGVLVIGDDTTVNGARLVAVNSNILIGRDGLWSDEILAQGFDQHGIIDVESGAFINLEKRDIVLGEHVWIGRRATLMPGTVVNRGSIVGACAVVTKDVPELSAVAGNPARIVRQGVTWSRPWTEVDERTRGFLTEI